MATQPKPSSLRQWIRAHSGWILWPTLLAILALAMLPMGPIVEERGVIQRIDRARTGGGSVPLATVRLDDGRVVQAGAFNCRVGQHVTVRSTPRIWGAARSIPCS